MTEKTFTITNERGMHVRPCVAFADLANKFDCDITVRHYGNDFRGKTGMHLMSAYIQQGNEITIVCSGTDEQEAMAALEALIETGFASALDDTE